ncbi:MAG: T9SS type A sorting domain-containing protein [Tannerellaceae bacterium]|jgi:hypothetical protein|nr:T9SS type A sorting domain-containing protein [Tannerellaceae bacterium]
MNRLVTTLLGVFFFIPFLQAQISYGGSPLPELLLRSVPAIPFEDMPAFDLAEDLRIDSLEENNLRGGYRFAHKFITDFCPDNAGIWTILPDGMKLWRLGIHSSGARSLSLLLTEYELPEGAQLFLYNRERTHVLGAFTHRNNSDFGILPLSAVDGEDLILEYQEPADASFSGKLRVGEVNHGYRDLRGVEPAGDYSRLSCVPAFICEYNDIASEEIGRSVVLLIINGTTACTGAMVNNTASDGKPYVLTASHCLNGNFTNTDFGQVDAVAGTIVTYFNYDSPLCTPVVRGTEEMSMASARCVVHNPDFDVALIELLEVPPVHYRPYYAGWNVSFSPPVPYFSIHHPLSSVKRLNWSDYPLSLSDFPTDGLPQGVTFHLTHWFINLWRQGCTDNGSSGSPLFDANERLIGALTGGYSTCSKPKSDYYYALAAAWQADGTPQQRLAQWLNPLNLSVSACAGLDPYEEAKAYRLSNVRNVVPHPRKDTDIDPLNAFGNKTEGLTLFAEAYHAALPLTVFGAYLVTQPFAGSTTLLNIDVCLYIGDERPEQLLHEEAFRPTYTNIGANGLFYETQKPLGRLQESFIRFDVPVRVPAGNFFIGYRITASAGQPCFSVCNMAPGMVPANTTWVFDGDEWQEATQYLLRPGSTSLYIDPVVQYAFSTAERSPLKPTSFHPFVSADRRLIHVLLPEEVATARLSVVDMSGRLLLEETLLAPSATLPVDFPSGVYLIRLHCDKEMYIRKVIL